MSQRLTLELADAVYADLQQQANAVGLSVTEWIVALLSKHDNDVNEILSSAEQQAAWQRFRNYAGAVSLGYATGIENDSIDADLAKAYANEYED